jgi:hypothetical protein
MIPKELVHDCTVNKVPFPALETLEDRRLFPKRYFLFFDTFVRAGRHNRYLGKKAIQDNNGENDKRFGPAIFEAHVRTTVRENYFKWIFQQLSDIHEVEDEDVRAFQLEYDHIVYTDLPKTLVCSHMELTKFPFKDFEIDYGVPANKKKTDNGLRKSWEALYKEIWNKHLLRPTSHVINIPIPQVNSIIRDMESDVNQLLADCSGVVEQV